MTISPDKTHIDGQYLCGLKSAPEKKSILVFTTGSFFNEAGAEFMCVDMLCSVCGPEARTAPLKKLPLQSG